MPFLVVPPLPNLRVEIAFDSGFATAEGDRTWTDISAYVEGASSVDITYGRADELSTPDPNTCSLTLDNRDGRFTPAKASSPYFPDVKKGKPLRVTVTYGEVDYVRFMGYVNQWPLVWPDGSSAASTVTISASSRRARLGQTAPLTSAIRAAYLATTPQAYWPLDDQVTLNNAGLWVFQDITNPTAVTTSQRNIGQLGAFFQTQALSPVLDTTTPGPTDELPLLKVPRFTDAALQGTFPHYVGGGGAVSINSSGGATIEMVARIKPYPGDYCSLTLFELFSAGRIQEMRLVAINEDALGLGAAVAATMFVSDPNSGVLIEQQDAVDATLYPTAADGEVHHYAMTLGTGGTVGKVYFDGVLIATLTMTNALTTRLTQVAMCADTYYTDAWIGHAAVHDRALTADEVLAHAQAATAASETDAERVVRVAGRIGVPADEIDVETSIAAPLGPQKEAGESASSVIDAVAKSTAGIAYDTRSGHLALQARQTRYNTTATFTLDATTQEVQGDLTAMTDDRYLLNTVEFSRVTEDTSAVPATVFDQDSIDDYGVYATSLTIISSSDQEVEAAAQDQLARFADGGATPRISQVSVDIVNLDDSQRAAVLAADIGTKFAIANLPPQAPSDPMNLFFEGASESITATSHTMTMNTTPGDIYTDVWIADSNDLMDSGIVVGY